MKHLVEPMNKKEPNQVIAGNRDGVGTSKFTLQKIASESRQMHRQSTNC